jgi:hypothetical protein
LFSPLIVLLVVSMAARLAHADSAKPPIHPRMNAWVISPPGADAARIDIHSAPFMRAPVVGKQPVGSPLTIYAVVEGDAAAKDNPLLYRVSADSAPPQFIYSQFAQVDDRHILEHGQLILISLSHQWLVAYHDGRRFLDTPVTTGRPELPTPTGTNHILAKFRDYTFISPWPASSPWYYPPSLSNYAMMFRTDGYFIHDAPWRHVYGPGTNLYHNDPSDPFGTHGCVNVPFTAEQELFNWAGVGATVTVVQ